MKNIYRFTSAALLALGATGCGSGWSVLGSSSSSSSTPVQFRYSQSQPQDLEVDAEPFIGTEVVGNGQRNITDGVVILWVVMGKMRPRYDCESAALDSRLPEAGGGVQLGRKLIRDLLHCDDIPAMAV